MLSKVLKVIKEIGKSLLVITSSAATGIVTGVAYLVLNGFKCLTSNITADISINPSQVNLTTIINEYENNQPIKLPIGVQLQDNNISECSYPLIVGAAIGLGASALYLTINYAHQCAKRHRKHQQTIVNEESALFPKEQRAACC